MPHRLLPQLWRSYDNPVGSPLVLPQGQRVPLVLPQVVGSKREQLVQAQPQGVPTLAPVLLLVLPLLQGVSNCQPV
jgi:hypothetical protein